MRTSFKYILVFMLSVLMGCVSSGGEMIPSSLPTLVDGNANQGNDPTDPSTNNQQTDPTDTADPNQGNQQTDPSDPGNQNQGNDPATDPNQGSNDPVNDPTDPSQGNNEPDPTDPADPIDPNQGNGGSNDPVTPVINVVDYKQDYANSSALTKVILSGSATDILINGFFGQNITDESRNQYLSELRENANGEYIRFAETRPSRVNPTYSDVDENGNNVRYAGVDVYGGNAVGLSYTDFGYWKSSIQTRNANGDLIDEKVTNLKMDFKTSTPGISTAAPTRDLVFTGKTYAAIKDGDEYSNQILSGDATLIRNNTTGDAEFYIRYDNWYDVAVTRNPNPSSSPLSYDFTFTKGANYQDNGYDFEGTKRGELITQYRGGTEVTEVGGKYYTGSPNDANVELEGVFGAKR